MTSNYSYYDSTPWLVTHGPSRLAYMCLSWTEARQIASALPGTRVRQASSVHNYQAVSAYETFAKAITDVNALTPLQEIP